MTMFSVVFWQAIQHMSQQIGRKDHKPALMTVSPARPVYGASTLAKHWMDLSQISALQENTFMLISMHRIRITG